VERFVNPNHEMTRALALLIACSSLAWSQTVATQKAFLHDVDALHKRVLRGQPIDPLVRLQEEIGLSASAAEAVLATVRAYNAEADKVDLRLKRSILTRRLQVAGDFIVTYSSELDVVNWANLELNLFLLEQMDELASTMDEQDYEKLLRFLDERALAASFFPFREGETGPSGVRNNDGWKQSPLGYWRDFIKTPLSGPEPESVFAQSFGSKTFPPEDVVPFLEGTVVSVTTPALPERMVLLSMQGEPAADAVLLIDGVDWMLTKEPEIGATVRFRGVAQEFTQEPFLILFAPERITGLAVDSKKPNPPFTSPSLAR
jgi:hypothetical protein